MIVLVWFVFFLCCCNYLFVFDVVLVWYFWVDVGVFKIVLKIGVLMGVQFVVILIVELVLLLFVNGFGFDVMVVYGVGMQIISYVQFLVMLIVIMVFIFGV